MTCTIPPDIMDFEGAKFFDFVKQYSGEKIATILEFQDITNVSCLVACPDPLEVLSFDSNDLLDLKKITCVKLNNNSFAVLPGVKSKMSLLRSTLSKKYQEIKKNAKKSLNMSTTNTMADNTSIFNNSNISTDIPGSTNTLSSIAAHSSSEETIKQYLVDSLNEWCKRIKQNNNENDQILELNEDVDYQIIIDVNGNKAIIKCKCGTASTLGKKENTYIVS